MEESKSSQKGFILEHLQKFGSITLLEAIQHYGCLRLAARISDLKKDGYNITTEMQTSVSRLTGRPVQFANYRLQG